MLPHMLPYMMPHLWNTGTRRSGMAVSLHRNIQLRRSIDGLYAIVVDKLNTEPDRRSIYLFCGKRSDRIKILIRENDGYVLLYKRLDSNIKGRFRWPRTPDEVKAIT